MNPYVIIGIALWAAAVTGNREIVAVPTGVAGLMADPEEPIVIEWLLKDREDFRPVSTVEVLAMQQYI